MENRRWFFLLLTLLSISIARGAFLRNVPQVVVQPNGDTLRCLASGDEYYNWMHDEDNYTIIRDPSDGFFVYARLAGNTLVPTRLIPGIDDPAAAGLVAGANIPPAMMLKLREQSILQAGPRAPMAPRTGTINNIVVFIRFADETEFTGSIGSYDGIFNSTAGGANSMRRFFNELSYGALTVSTTFHPIPAGDAVLSYQDSHPRSYFMPYSAGNPGGYTDDQRAAREHTLLRDALNAISAQVPPELDLDGDGDGYVDNVCFIITGSPTAWATLLWPHMWSLYSYTVLLNGKTVGSYNFNIQSMANTSVLCHEMGHSLGAPDLYRYAYNGMPVGNWDLMAYNTNPPQHMGAHMKMKYGTWISEIPTISASGTYTLSPITSPTNNAFRIQSPNSAWEYFVVEYRKREGTFESALPNEGLLVYRINTLAYGNAAGPPDEVYVYRPGGTPGSDGNVSSAPFSGNSGRTSIDDWTDPSSFLSDGSPGGLSISNVTAIGSTISFDVDISSPPVVSSVAPSSGPVGSIVTISGRHFSPDPAGNLVRFGPVRAQVLTSSNSELQVLVPPGAVFGCVTVTAAGMTAYSSERFDVTFSTNDTLGAASFAGRFDISPGKSVAIGDFDSDGLTDIVAANSAGDVVSVRRNAGTPGSLDASSFNAPITLGTGSWPFSLAVADLDGDGRLDIVAANEVSNTLSVFANSSPSPGAISFAGRVDYPTGATPWGISVGDLDLDGKPDLVFSNHGNNTISVYRNTSAAGAVSFAPRVDFATQASPRGTAVGDVDGDLLPDVIVANSGSQAVSIFRNTSADGDLSLAPPFAVATGNGPVVAALGDLDGDDIPDLTVANAAANTISIFRNLSTPGSLSFGLRQDIAGGGKYASLGDLDGDGAVDLAVATGASNTLAVLGNSSSPGAITMTPKASFPVGANPWNCAVADLDGDGKPDLISCNGTANTLSILPNVMRAPIVRVTVGTDPPEYVGRIAYWVDGIRYDSARTFEWTEGTMHSIRADTAQYDGPLSRITWSHWSDSGSIDHIVSATTDTSFIAHYQRQHYVNTGGYWPSPATNATQVCVMVVTPFDGWYDEGDSLTLTCHIQGCDMAFSHWTGTGPGSYTGTANPASIIVDGPITEEPSVIYCDYSFSPGDTSFSLAGGRGSVRITATSDSCHWSLWTSESWIVIDSQGIGSGTGSIGYTVLANPDTFPRVARIQAQGMSHPWWRIDIYQAGSAADHIQVIIQTEPTGLDIFVDDVQYTSPRTFNWIKDFPHYIRTTTTQAGDTGIRHLWMNWSDSGGAYHTIQPTASSTYTAYFRTEFYLDLRDSMDMGCLMSPGTGWYLKDTCLEIHFQGCDAGGPIEFSHWTGYGEGSYGGTDNPAGVCIRGPITEVASFVYCTLAGLSGYDTTFDHNGGNGTVTVLGRSCARYSAWLNDTSWADIDANDDGYAGAVIPYTIQPNPDSVDRSITMYVMPNTSHSVPFELVITQKGIPVCAGLSIDSALSAPAGAAVWVDLLFSPDTLRIGSIDCTVGFDTAILAYADSFIVHPIIPAASGWIVDVNGNNSAGTVTLGAFDAVGVTNPLAGSGPIVSLKFNVSPGGVPGTATPLALSAASATDTGARPICVTTTDGLLTIPLAYDITGRLWYFHNARPIIGDTVDLFNPGFPAAPQASAPSYTFVDVPSGMRDSIRPRGIPGLFPQPGTITSGDALRAFRGRAGGPAPLLNGYQMLAADANGDTIISSGDALAILKRATGTFPNFLGFGLPDWRYVDSSFAIDPSTCHSSPDHICVTELVADLDGKSFIGVIRGDVDGSFGILPGPGPLATAPRGYGGGDVLFSIPDTLLGRPGDTLMIPVAIDPSGNPLGSLDATISYDTMRLAYLDSFAVGPAIPVSAGWVVDAFHDAVNGRVTIGAVNFGDPGMVPSGTGMLAAYRFRIREDAATGDTSRITFVATMATDSNASPLATLSYDGRLRIVSELLPPLTSLLFPPDGGDGVATAVLLRWGSTPYAGGYDLQAALDSAFTTILVAGTSISDTVFDAADLPPGTMVFWRVRAVNSTGPGPWSASWRFSTTNTAQRTISLTTGWNIASLPVEVEDSARATLFPDAVSNAYAFESAYVQKSHLTRGVGYWMKFDAAIDVVIEGLIFGPLSIPISEGWNLIGGTSFVVGIADISSTPGGIVTGNFFGYQGGYEPVTELLPGLGYWVKSAQAGVLHLGSPGPVRAGSGITVAPTGELPPPPPGDDITAGDLPTEFFLGRSYPNPFNPSVVIEFGLPEPSAVSLVVVDLLGRTVGTLLEGDRAAGMGSARWDASTFPAGVYFYRLKAEGLSSGVRFDRTEKMLLLK